MNCRRTPRQCSVFREALDEGLSLEVAMLLAGYSPKVARQGRAKLCGGLRLDLEDWERERERFKRGVLFVCLCQPGQHTELESMVRLWARRKRERQKYSRRNPVVVIQLAAQEGGE